MAFQLKLQREFCFHALAPAVRQRRFVRVDLWQEKLQNRAERFGEDGVALRRERVQTGLQNADARNYGSVEQRGVTTEVRRLGRQRRSADALALFAEVQDPDPLLRTAAMDACSKSQQLLPASRIFAEMPVKTVAAYNVYIGLLGRMKRLDEARALMGSMKASCLEPTEVTFTSLIDAHGMVSDAEGAASVFADMEARGMPASAISCGAVLTACGRAGDRARVAQFLTLMDTRQLQLDARHLTASITASMQHKDEAGAQAAFDEFRRRGLRPNVIAYTIMVNCFQGPEAVRKADALFSQMREEGISPDEFFYNALLGAAERARDWNRFEALLTELDQSGLQRNRETQLRVRAMEKVRAAKPLPFGWQEAQDPASGQTYYWQTTDPANTTTWQRPLRAFEC